MTKALLVGDIGGTKTLLRLVDGTTHRTLHEQRYDSKAYATFGAIVAEFLQRARVVPGGIDAACFAVAGPVTRTEQKSYVQTTNLPWFIESDIIAQQFGFARVVLLNDFEAVGFGITAVSDEDLVILQNRPRNLTKPKLVIGAGTGLGVSQVVPTSNGFSVLPSEGGHLDFAPNSEQEIRLLRNTFKEFGHVSYERFVSGPGLVELFQFCLSDRPPGEDIDRAAVASCLNAADPAAAIAAAYDMINVAREAVDLFIKLYGAHAGNLALVNLPYGGLYIAGGIAPKMIELLRRGQFLASFHAKGRMRPLLEAMPVAVVMKPDVGLLGALVAAKASIKTKVSIKAKANI